MSPSDSGEQKCKTAPTEREDNREKDIFQKRREIKADENNKNTQ